jgi:hypothetical protein
VVLRLLVVPLFGDIRSQNDAVVGGNDRDISKDKML